MCNKDTNKVIYMPIRDNERTDCEDKFRTLVDNLFNYPVVI